MKTLYEAGSGDDHVLLEENRQGHYLLTTNADTRNRVRPAQYSGWPEQRDAGATQQWLVELTTQFGGNRTLALGFARRAGARGVPRR